MITIFTTSTCSYCSMVKKYLTNKGKEFEVVDLENNPELRQQLFEKTGAMTVPIIESDGNYVIGWQPAQLARLCLPQVAL